MGLIGVVKPGNTVFFYNRWTGFENNEIRDSFQEFNSEKEAKKVKTGDIVWIDEEPYSLHGKVYGFTCCVVKKVEKDGEHNQIFYGDGGMISSVLYHKLAKVTDEAKLISLIAQYPRALNHPIA